MRFLFTDPTLLTVTVPVQATRAMRKRMTDDVEKQGRRIGELLRDGVVKGIKKQRFPHVPLKKSYRKWKVEHNLDKRILMSTGDYVGSISVRSVTRDPQGNVVVVVGPRVGMHYSGFSYGKLAKIHEFGVSDKLAWFKNALKAVGASSRKRRVPSASVPARPHWRPVFNAFKSTSREHANALAKELAAGLREALKPYIGPKPVT